MSDSEESKKSGPAKAAGASAAQASLEAITRAGSDASQSEESKATAIVNAMEVMIEQFKKIKDSGALTPNVLENLSSILPTAALDRSKVAKASVSGAGAQKAKANGAKDKAPAGKPGDDEKPDRVANRAEKEEDRDDDAEMKDMSDFVVIDDADEDADGTKPATAQHDDREEEEGQAAAPGIWAWKRTFKAIDRALKLELPGATAFNRPPRGVDTHPRAKEPHFQRIFEDMRNECHGYLTFKTPQMKAAVTWYNRTVKDPHTRLSVINERVGTSSGPGRRPLREADLSSSPALFSLMHPFVWSDESNFSLGVPQMLPRLVVKEWENRDQELISLENISVQLRRGAQLQALVFGELQKFVADAGDGESAAELARKLQPALADLNDLTYFLCNRTTALSGLAGKASRRVVVDAMRIPQHQVPDVLYSHIGSPLFNRDSAGKLMSMTPRFDRFGHERPPPQMPPQPGPPAQHQHQPAPPQHGGGDGGGGARYDDGPSTFTGRRGGGNGGGSPSDSTSVKRELVNEINRLISAARRIPGYTRDGGGDRGGSRRRSRSRSPVYPRRRSDSRF